MKKKVLIIVICLCICIFLSIISSISNKEQYLDEDLNNNINIINAVNEKGVDKKIDYKKILNGKSIAMIGDSLIEGYGNENGGLNVYLAKKMPNAQYSNYSKSGSTVTNNTGDGNIIMANQARSIGVNPNIILFDGGVNDIIGYDMNFLNVDLKKPIGTIDLDNPGVSQDNSVMADFEEVVQILKSRFPNAELCYVQLCLLDDTSINMLAKQVEHKDEMKQRRDELFSQIKLLCQKWDINYLDLSSKFVGTGIQYRQEDWLHINEEGYKLVAPYILSYMAESISE